jgi:hypothetical protein
MRRSTLLAALTAICAMLLGTAAATAQPGDPYEALLPGAVSYASLIASASAGASDLYLTQIYDYGGAQFGFTTDAGESAAWGYYFYSPSRDSMYAVIVGSQSGTVFTTLASGTFASASAAAPLALDTSGSFAHSAALAEKLRADADYQAFLNAHPDLNALSVRLVMIEGQQAYPLPPGMPVDKAVWVATTPSFGDSIHICYLPTGTGTLDCGTTFYRGLTYSVGMSTVSNVTFGVSNFGFFGGDIANQSAAFEAPAGSGNTYIFGAGLWFGARKRVGGSIAPRVFVTYDPNSGSSWAQPGEGYVDRLTFSVPELYNAGSFDRTTGEPTFGDFNWPLWLSGADTGASMMSPGTFVPLNGNRSAGGDLVRPAFVAGLAEQYVARYSDQDTTLYATNPDVGGFPLGLQFQENIFAQPGGLDHTVIVTYEIINRSSDTLFDAVAGVVTDFDIGQAANDRTRFYVQRPDLRTAIAWSGNEARPTPYGLLVMTLLEAPLTDDAGYITGDRAQFRTQGTVGTYQAWTIETDPSGSAERYSFMTSGDLDPDAGAGDYRGLLATEKFSMRPGDTAHVAVAYVVNRDRLAIAGSDPTLEGRIESVTNAYYGLAFSGVRTSESTSGALSLAAAPNPANDVVALRLTLGRASTASVEIYDHLGTRVLSRELGGLGAGVSLRTLDVASLASGAYIVVARCGGERVSLPLVITR